MSLNHLLQVFIIISCLFHTERYAQASITYETQVIGRYFKAMDKGVSDQFYSASWRWWLKVHRMINANPQLARKLSRHPLMQTSYRQVDIHGAFQEANAPLSWEQITKVPTHIYTLHLASYRKQRSLQSFLHLLWMPGGLRQLKVYHTNPKSLLLLVSGEFRVKQDPLYSQRVIVKQRKFIRIGYGVYENIQDAKADRKVLQRHLKLPIAIMRADPTNQFIHSVWLSGVAGKYLDPWETQIR